MKNTDYYEQYIYILSPAPPIYEVLVPFQHAMDSCIIPYGHDICHMGHRQGHMAMGIWEWAYGHEHIY